MKLVTNKFKSGGLHEKHVEKVVKFLCFGVIRTRFFILIFFNILVLFPKEDPCCHCLGVKGVTPSGFAVIETDPRLPNLSVTVRR